VIEFEKMSTAPPTFLNAITSHDTFQAERFIRAVFVLGLLEHHGQVMNKFVDLGNQALHPHVMTLYVLGIPLLAQPCLTRAVVFWQRIGAGLAVIDGKCHILIVQLLQWQKDHHIVLCAVGIVHVHVFC